MKITNNEKLAGFFGVEEFQVGEEGAMINAPLISTLEAKIDEMKANAELLEKAHVDLEVAKKSGEESAQTITTLNAKVTELTAAVEASKKSLADALAASEKSLADAKEAADKAMADKQKEVDGAIAAVKDSEAKIAERDSKIEDLNSQLEALQANPGEEVKAGAQPASNGTTGAGSEPQAPVWDSNLSATENKQKMKDYQAMLKKAINS